MVASICNSLRPSGLMEKGAAKGCTKSDQLLPALELQPTPKNLLSKLEPLEVMDLKSLYLPNDLLIKSSPTPKTAC